MDFGTWISKGIPYANQNGETFLRKKYLGQAPAVSNENQRIVLTKESDIAFLSDCKAKLEAFIEDDTQIEFVFDKCNSQQKINAFRFTYQIEIVRGRFHNSFTIRLDKFVEQAKTKLYNSIVQRNRNHSSVSIFRIICFLSF